MVPFDRGPPGSAAEAQVGADIALAALKQPGERLLIMQRRFRRQPGHPVAHLEWGNALLDLDRTTEAIDHFETVICKT